jgi:alpha-ketoglutarate-dependent taurine dioxygenase
MSSRLDEVEVCLRLRGWGIYTEAGVVRRGTVDTEAVAELCATFGVASSRDGGTEQWPIRPTSTDRRSTFSQCAGAAPLHTDAAYRDDPEPLFALVCVRPAEDGGYTRLLAVSDAVRGLDPLLVRRLRVPQWRWRVPEVFGGGLSGRHSVLFDGDTGMRWRPDNLVVPGDLADSAARLAAHLETHPMVVQVLLPTDSVLLCDNRRTLHGRSGFADPRRWLIRIRLEHR